MQSPMSLSFCWPLADSVALFLVVDAGIRFHAILDPNAHGAIGLLGCAGAFLGHLCAGDPRSCGSCSVCPMGTFGARPWLKRRRRKCPNVWISKTTENFPFDMKMI